MSSPTKLPLPLGPQNAAQLKRDLADAQRKLAESERELAEEQAGVNRFRMQCRLKIGDLVDELQLVRATKQQLLTTLALRQQEENLSDIFADAEGVAGLSDSAADDALLQSLPQTSTIDKAAEKRLYRELARRFHPDLAGASLERAYATSIMSAVNNAYSAGDIDTLRDLAGELNPGDIAELAAIETKEIRQLRKRLLACRRRRRKCLIQLQTLRQESTCRLWRRSLELDADGVPWWQEVDRAIREAIQRINQEIASLQASTRSQESEER